MDERIVKQNGSERPSTHSKRRKAKRKASRVKHHNKRR